MLARDPAKNNKKRCPNTGKILPSHSHNFYLSIFFGHFSAADSPPTLSPFSIFFAAALRGIDP